MVEPRRRSSKSGRSEALSATRRGRRCACRQFWRGRVAVSWQVRTIRGSSQMGAYASGAPGWARAPGRLARWPAPGLRPLCARTDVAVTSRQSLQRLERRPPVRLTEHAMRPAGPSVKVKSGTMVETSRPLPQRLIRAVRDDAAPVRTKRHTLDRTGVAGQRSSAVLAGSGGTDGLPLRPAR